MNRVWVLVFLAAVIILVVGVEVDNTTLIGLVMAPLIVAAVLLFVAKRV